MTPETQTTKEKIDKLDIIKTKKISTLKDTIKRVKRKPTESKDVFINLIRVCLLYTSDAADE